MKAASPSQPQPDTLSCRGSGGASPDGRRRGRRRATLAPARPPAQALDPAVGRALGRGRGVPVTLRCHAVASVRRSRRTVRRVPRIQVSTPPRTTAETGSAHHVQRVVRAEVDAGDAVEHGQRPDHDPAAPAQVRRQQRGDAERDDRVPGREAVAGRRHVAQDGVRLGAARPFPVHQLLDDRLLDQELQRDERDQGDREPDPAPEQGDERDAGRQPAPGRAAGRPTSASGGTRAGR